MLLLIVSFRLLASNVRQKTLFLEPKPLKTLEIQGFSSFWDYSHSKVWNKRQFSQLQKLLKIKGFHIYFFTNYLYSLYFLCFTIGVLSRVLSLLSNSYCLFEVRFGIRANLILLFANSRFLFSMRAIVISRENPILNALRQISSNCLPTLSKV